VPDLRQDIYVRMYESARDALPTSPKALLFATARNLMIDRMRHHRVVHIVTEVSERRSAAHLSAAL
jgi:RNA polymerase sigma-70 factor (ECF subfamily)